MNVERMTYWAHDYLSKPFSFCFIEVASVYVAVITFYKVPLEIPHLPIVRF